MIREEEECVYPLGVTVACKEFLMKIDVAFGVYAWVSQVGLDFDGAVDVFVIEGFVEVSAVAEYIKGGVPAVDVPLLWVIGVGKQVHGGAMDSFLSSTLRAFVCTDVISRFSE